MFSHTAGTYIPKKEIEVVETIRATIIQPNQAIRLRARKETKVTFKVFRYSFLETIPNFFNWSSLSQIDVKFTTVIGFRLNFVLI